MGIQEFNELRVLISKIRQARISSESAYSELWQTFEKIVKDLLQRLGISVLRLEHLPLQSPEWVEFDYYLDSNGLYGEHDKMRCSIRANEDSLFIDLDPLYKGAGQYVLEKLDRDKIKVIMSVVLFNLGKANQISSGRRLEEDQEVRGILEALSAIIAEM